MNCEESRNLIEAFFDQEPDEKTKSLLKNHFEFCDSCRAGMRRARALNALLQKAVIPPPSPKLAARSLEAFRAHHQIPAQSNWLKKLFSGSVIIPKPIFAAALALALLAVAGAGFVGRNFNTGALQTVSSTAPVISEKIKTVEVPVIKTVEVPIEKEKIVNRIVYVNRPHNNSARQNKTRRREGFIPSAFVAGNKYSAAASLKGFQPLPEIKTEIIKAGDLDEK